MGLAEDGGALDPRRLLVFREVARRGSLSAAAVALGWTQPAVGQHVQRLERDVGLALVLRSSRGVTLTEAGAALLVHADGVASRLATATEELRGLRELRSGRLRLAAFPSASATLVPAALARLAKVAPGLEVRLTELEPPQARSAVLAGDVDLALVFRHDGEPAETSHDLVETVLIDDPVHLVVPLGHPILPADGPVGLGRLRDERWVAGCPRCRTHLVGLAAAAGFVADIRHETDDYVVVQTLVAAGLAVALLPALALRAVRDPGVVPLELAGRPAREISVISRQEGGALPAVTATVRALVRQGNEG